MNIRTLKEGDKYCLIFTVEKRRDMKLYRKKQKLKEGFYFYVGEHHKDVHKAGKVVFLRRMNDIKNVHENVKKMSEETIPFKTEQKKIHGYLHYFSENPLFELKCHEAIDV